MTRPALSLLLPLTLATALVIPTAAFGADPHDRHVEVVLQDPDGFTDVNPDHLLDELHAFLVQQSWKYARDGRTLRITITDVDMAGGFDLTRGMQFDHVRQMRETFPPRIELSFTVKDVDGRILQEASRELVDRSYLMRARPASETDPLFYEKLMIREWLMREFSDN